MDRTWQEAARDAVDERVARLHQRQYRLDPHQDKSELAIIASELTLLEEARKHINSFT